MLLCQPAKDFTHFYLLIYYRRPTYFLAFDAVVFALSCQCNLIETYDPGLRKDLH